MSAEVWLLLIGALFVGVGVLGGGIEIKEIRIPKVGMLPRLGALFIGFIFIGMSLTTPMIKTSAPPVTPNVNQPATATSLVSNVASTTTMATSTPSPTSTAIQSALSHTVTKSPAGNNTPDHDAILAAIQSANNAEIAALRDLDPSYLQVTFTGQALTNRLQQLEFLKQNGLYQIARLHRVHQGSITVSPDGQYAQVERVEVWSSGLYLSSTRQCQFVFPEHQVPQTIHLVYRNNKWLVSGFDFHSSAPNPVSCG